MFGSVVASAATYNDPTGDTCKVYQLPQPTQFCGADVLSAGDKLDADGTAHVIVTTNTAHCTKPGFDFGDTRVRYAILKSSATTPNESDEFGEISADFGTDNFFYRVGGNNNTALTGVVQHDATTTTYDISLPTSITNTFGSSFKWMVGNNCSGELPWEAPDIAPDTGLYGVTLTVPPSAPARPTGVVARPATTTSTTTGPIVVTYVAGADHGSAITQFTATCTSSNGGVTRSAMHVGSTAAAITVTGATLAKSYTCTVHATNGVGTSPESKLSPAITVGAPARVAKPTAVNGASGTLSVSFTLLTTQQANGSPLTAPNYTATCVSSDGGTTRSATAAASPIIVSSLTAGKTYTCAVKAHNARGFGRKSAPSLAVVA